MEEYNTMNKIFQNKEYLRTINSEMDVDIVDFFITESSRATTWGRTVIMPTGKYWLGKNNIGKDEEITDKHISDLREYLSTFFHTTPCNSAENISMMNAYARYTSFLKLYDMIKKYTEDLTKAQRFLNFAKTDEIPMDVVKEVYDKK